MQDLGLSYLDLYLMHWPVAFVPGEKGVTHPQNPDGSYMVDNVPLADTWAAMQVSHKSKITPLNHSEIGARWACKDNWSE